MNLIPAPNHLLPYQPARLVYAKQCLVLRTHSFAQLLCLPLLDHLMLLLGSLNVFLLHGLPELLDLLSHNVAGLQELAELLGRFDALNALL